MIDKIISGALYSITYEPSDKVVLPYYFILLIFNYIIIIIFLV